MSIKIRCRAIKATKPDGETLIFGEIAGKWYMLAWSHDLDANMLPKMHWNVFHKSMSDLVNHDVPFQVWELELLFKKKMNILLSKSFIVEG